MDGLIAFYSQDSEKQVMLDNILNTVSEKMPAQDRLSILSIGCGTGIFEEPFLTSLLSQNKSIEFVGVEPNETECMTTQKWCKKLSNSAKTQFEFTIHPVVFEKFAANQQFDIILLVHSIYSFPNIEASIRQVYELLKPEGIGTIAIELKRQLLNAPYCRVHERLYDKMPHYSEDIQAALTQCSLPFRQTTINCAVNITECFNQESKLGKHLLDFMIGANTSYWSPLQLRLLLDYFGTASEKIEGNQIMLPLLTNLFYLEKP